MAAVLSFREHPEAYGLTPLKPDHRGKGWQRPAIRNSGKLVLPKHYDSTLIRPLELIPGLELKPASLKGQVKPKYTEADFSQCHIDQNYQREIDQANITVIEFGVNHFDYTLFKIPNGIQGPSGKIYITDGQSSALICLHHPDIDKLPIMVTRVNEAEFIARCARAFIGLNECRIAVSKADRFTALQTMGDPASCAIANVFRKHGITPVRKTKAIGKYAARETRIIGTFESIHARRGEAFFDRLCKVLGGAAFSPIRRIHIGAITEILLPDMGKNKIDDDRLISAIRSMVDKHAINEAELSAKRRMWTGPKALAELYKSLYKDGAQAL